MMEILFRAQKAKRSGWVYGSYIDMGDDTDQAFIYEKVNCASPYTCQQLVAMDMILIIKKTVGWFTGIHDKNGKKVFDGDICTVLFKDGTWARMLVVWDDDGHRFMLKPMGGIPHSFFGDIEFEVVGNKFDNPELLGVQS